jgi:rRNA maturation protein Rpf1
LFIRFTFLLIALLVLGVRVEGQSVIVTDPTDMADSSGDIRLIRAYVLGEDLVLSMTVEGSAAPAIEQTPDTMSNRYYYHWLLDTDNNLATGWDNSLYENNPTGVQTPIGADRVVMIGWRDGKPNGVEVYDPADDNTILVSGYAFQAKGNTLTAMIPVAELGLGLGQTIAFSAFQEGASDGWAVDWVESASLTLEGPSTSSASVNDVADMADSSGDIRSIQAHVLGEDLVLSMTVEGSAAPAIEQTPDTMSNRYYYHWLLDTDNNLATGWDNSLYENNPTGVQSPIGADRVVMIGWRDGKPNGVEVYDPADDNTILVSAFTCLAGGNTLRAVIPLADLGLGSGQTIAVSAFQEGASDGWAVDWIESASLTLEGPTGPSARVTDPTDMADSSGDIRGIQAHVLEGDLVLSMTVEVSAAPLIEQTPDAMSNRYYYHWLLDTDNNIATGWDNSLYENNPTGVQNPIGADRVVMIGWRDGKPNGVEVYDPADDNTILVSGYTYLAGGNTLKAVIPLEHLGLGEGQTIAVSAFQEGASDGWAVDWIESAVLTLESLRSGRMLIDGQFDDWAEALGDGVVTEVTDPTDMADSSGDIRSIQLTVENDNLFLRMSVEGVAMPSVDETPPGMNNRYYYHFLLDTDNNVGTGWDNSQYENNPTGVQTPIGADRVVMLGWRDGNPNGIEVYDPADDSTILLADFDYQPGGDSFETKIPLSALGLGVGQTIAFSAFQEGASDGWAVDWVESAVVTLSEGGSSELPIPVTYAANAYGFRLETTDDQGLEVNPDSVTVEVDGEDVAVQVTKEAGVTTIAGKNPSLFPQETLHTISLAVEVSGTPASQDFVFRVEPYTLMPSEDRVETIDTSHRGFLTTVTAISSDQIVDGSTSLHKNLAELAEQQHADGFANDPNGPYINEADPDYVGWKPMTDTTEGVINWYELAPAEEHTKDFGGDDPIPWLSNTGFQVLGVVVEFLTYVELEEGWHTLKLLGEGGYKVTAGFDPNGPLIMLWDNSITADKIPSYYAQNAFFNLVAPASGYYPIRILWFQSERGQENGLLLEFSSIEEQEPHLVNQSTDPLSKGAYLAGPLLGSGSAPTVTLQQSESGLTLEWTGQLLMAEDVEGPWVGVAFDDQSPMSVDVQQGTRMIFRSRSY